MRRKPHGFYSEFTVLGVFVAVAMFGFAYAGMSLIFGGLVPSSMVKEDALVAPTVEEYQAEASAVMAPFLAQARTMTVAELVSAGPAFVALIETTENRLLGMRVPTQMRDAHLSLVLLLAQWKRAANGSSADSNVVSARTGDVLAAEPWLTAEGL